MSTYVCFYKFLLGYIISLYQHIHIYVSTTAGLFLLGKPIYLVDVSCFSLYISLAPIQLFSMLDIYIFIQRACFHTPFSLSEMIFNIRLLISHMNSHKESYIHTHMGTSMCESISVFLNYFHSSYFLLLLSTDLHNSSLNFQLTSISCSLPLLTKCLILNILIFLLHYQLSHFTLVSNFISLQSNIQSQLTLKKPESLPQQDQPYFTFFDTSSISASEQILISQRNYIPLKQ